MITTVAFDADNTLVDTQSAVRAGLVAVAAELDEAELTLELLWADSAEVWAAAPERPAWELRKQSLQQSLRRVRREGELERITELFFEVRFAHSRPFPGVLEVLGKLRGDYQLGYATNANSRAERCGLAGEFDFELYALVGGVPKKPDPGFYAEMVRLAQAKPEEIVYVGDDYEHDIAGPARFGMRTVWLNRDGAAVPGPVQPDTVIQNLMDLPRILAE